MIETISRAEAIRLARANRARVEAVMRAEVERDPGSEEVSVEELQARIAELEEAADVRARMMDRARVLYQAAHPGTADRWPDGAVTVAWMVERIAELEAKLAVTRDDAWTVVPPTEPGYYWGKQLAHWDEQVVQVYCPHGVLRVIVASEYFDRPLEDIALWWPVRVPEPPKEGNP